MFITWEGAKREYPDKWIVFRNPQYLDEFDMKLHGGEFVGVGDTQTEMFSLIPKLDDGNDYTARHTKEDEAVGLFYSGV